METLGITRALHQLIYMMLNSVALLAWRLDSAILGMAILSYETQDWLTAPDGGVWTLLIYIAGVDGLLGLATWEAFLLLAVMLFGISRLLRNFWPTLHPVDPSRLLFFATLSYIFITQGPELMKSIFCCVAR